MLAQAQAQAIAAVSPEHIGAFMSLVTLIVSLWTRASVAQLETRLTKENAEAKEKAADRCQKCRDQLRREMLTHGRPSPQLQES